MDRINKILILFLIVILLAGCSRLFNLKPPDDKRVREAVSQIKNEEIAKNKANNFASQLIDDISKWLKSNSFWIKMVAVAMSIAVLIVIVFFVVRHIFSQKYVYQRNIELKKEISSINYDEKYLNKLISDRDYSKALLYLHHYSIFYLVTNKITYKKNMTNRDFYKKIKDKNQAMVFKKIYLICEKILFDDYKATEYDYDKCYKEFNKYYLMKQVV